MNIQKLENLIRISIWIILLILALLYINACLCNRRAYQYIDTKKKLEMVFVYDDDNNLVEYKETPIKTIESVRQEKFEFHGEIMYILGAVLLAGGLVVSVVSKNPVIERIGLFSFLGGATLLASGLFLCLSASYFAIMAVCILTIAGIYLIMKFWV